MASDLLIIVGYTIIKLFVTMKSQKKPYEVPSPSEIPEVQPERAPEFPEMPGDEPEEIPEEEPGKIPEEEPEKIPKKNLVNPRLQRFQTQKKVVKEFLWCVEL